VRAAVLPSPLLAVPNVTAHPSTASVPNYDVPLLCGFNVAIKGLRNNCHRSYATLSTLLLSALCMWHSNTDIFFSSATLGNITVYKGGPHSRKSVGGVQCSSP